MLVMPIYSVSSAPMRAHLLGGSCSTAAMRARSPVSGRASRSSTPRVTLRASFAAFSSAGLSSPTCWEVNSPHGQGGTWHAVRCTLWPIS